MGDLYSKLKNWLKKISIAGFLFFGVKGLIWIAIFLWAKYQLMD